MTIKTKTLIVSIICIFTNLATADDLPIASDMSGDFFVACGDMRELPDTTETSISYRPSLGKNKASRGKIVVSFSIIPVPHMGAWEDEPALFEDEEEEPYNPYADFEMIMPQEPISTLIEVSSSKLTDIQSYISFL